MKRSVTGHTFRVRRVYSYSSYSTYLFVRPFSKSFGKNCCYSYNGRMKSYQQDYRRQNSPKYNVIGEDEIVDNRAEGMKGLYEKNVEEATIITLISSCKTSDEAIHLYNRFIRLEGESFIAKKHLYTHMGKLGDIDKVNQLFGQSSKSAEEYTALLAVAGHDQFTNKEIIDIFLAMRQQNMWPSRHVLTIITEAILKLSLVDLGRDIELQFKTDLPNRAAANLLDLYFRVDRLDHAESLYRRIKSPTKHATVNMIIGYSIKGMTEEALKLFDKYNATSPNVSALRYLLYACQNTRDRQASEKLLKYCTENEIPKFGELQSQIEILKSILEQIKRAEDKGVRDLKSDDLWKTPSYLLRRPSKMHIED